MDVIGIFYQNVQYIAGEEFRQGRSDVDVADTNANNVNKIHTAFVHSRTIPMLMASRLRHIQMHQPEATAT